MNFVSPLSIGFTLLSEHYQYIMFYVYVTFILKLK